MPDSTRPRRQAKRRKTRPKSKADVLQAARDYKRESAVPLLVHTTGRWARKIRGRLHYFGSVDPDAPDFGAGAALAVYQEQREDLEAGRLPRAQRDGITVRVLCNRFLNEWRGRVEIGELHERSWQAYKRACVRVVGTFGRERAVDDLRADDFAKLRQRLARVLSPSTLSVEIARVKTLFGYAYDAELIDRPIRFGATFRPPPKRILRQSRNGHGARVFSAEEIRTLLEAATPRMKPMILLAINAAVGPSDLARMEFGHLDLEARSLDYPRHKTGVGRRAKLWGETTAAIREWLTVRPKPTTPDLAERVFLTTTGNTLAAWDDNPIGVSFRKLLKRTGLYRRGRGLYDLRRTHRTVSDATRDPVACDYVMGHSDPTMGGVYRQGIDDSRLEAVAQVVHDWLFPAEGTEWNRRETGKAGRTPAKRWLVAWWSPTPPPAAGWRPGGKE
jgi:integrase